MDVFKSNIISSGIDPNVLKPALKWFRSQSGIPIENLDRKVKSGYVGKPKGSLQIAFGHLFSGATLKIHDIPVSMH